MPSILETANELREQGNQHFRQQAFVKALQCYDKGAQIISAALKKQVPATDEPPQEELKAAGSLLEGNSSQALFQLARYNEAYERAKRALDSGTVKDPLKLRFRAASSLAYAGRAKECREQFPDMVSVIAALEELEAKKQPYKVIPSSCRATCRVRLEYYWMGNENGSSYLSPLINKDRLKEHRVCLVGSSGDARHALATIRDFAIRKDSLLELHVVDWEPRTCARTLILLTMLRAWGRSRKENLGTGLQDKLFELFWFILLSIGISRETASLLDCTIKALIAALEGSKTVVVSTSHSNGQKTSELTVEAVLKDAVDSLIWSKTVFVKSSNVPQLVSVLKSWQMDGDPIAPLSIVANAHKPSRSSPADPMSGMMAQMMLLGASGLMDNLIRGLDSKDKCESFARFLPDPSRMELSPGIIVYDASSNLYTVDWRKMTIQKFHERAKVAFNQWGAQASQSEIELWQNAFENRFLMLTTEFGRRLVKAQMETLIALPDSNSVTKTKIVIGGAKREIMDDPTKSESLVQLIETCLSSKDANTQLDKHFVVNPTTAIHSTSDERRLRDHMDESVVSSIVHVKQITDGLNKEHFPSEHAHGESMVARMGRFMAPVAELLFTVSAGKQALPKVRLTFTSENADHFSLDRLRKLDVVAAENKLVPLYDVIRLSNIPDYFGLLNACVGFMPLLRSGPSTVTHPSKVGDNPKLGAPFLSHEILYNTSVFRNLESYLTGALCLGSGTYEEYSRFGFRLLSGTIFHSDILWDHPSPNPTMTTLHPSEALLWLQRIFRSVSEPPVQRPGMAYGEIFPNTLATVFKVVDWLARQGLVTKHVAAQLCEQFITAGVRPPKRITTRARAPMASPVPPEPSSMEEEDIGTWLSAFHFEFRAVGSLMRPLLSFPLFSSANPNGGAADDSLLVPSLQVKQVTFTFAGLQLASSSMFMGSRFPLNSHDANSPLGLGVILLGDNDADRSVIKRAFAERLPEVIRKRFPSDAQSVPFASLARQGADLQFIPALSKALSSQSSLHLFSVLQLTTQKQCSVFMCPRDLKSFQENAKSTVVFLYASNMHSICEFSARPQYFNEVFTRSMDVRDL